MSSCKKATTKKYLKRKGPPYHAKDCKGSVKSGNDGKLYISSPDKRGVYKWVLNNKNNKTKKVKPAHDASIKTYKIHDNGAVPYIAMIKPKSRIEVYSTNKKVLDIAYSQLFVGDNLLPYTFAVKKGKANGNSLLIKTGVNKYIYVGSEIYSFETKEEIKAGIEKIKSLKGPVLLEIKCRSGHRKNLWRPTRSPIENKSDFMHFLAIH
jgi:WD40 repeat protein